MTSPFENNGDIMQPVTENQQPPDDQLGRIGAARLAVAACLTAPLLFNFSPSKPSASGDGKGNIFWQP